MKPAFAVVALSAFLACAAQAQDVQLGGQRFSPAGSADGNLGTEGAETRPDFDPYVALYAHWALDPVVVHDEAGNELGSLVEHAVGLDLALSLSLAYGLEIGATLPVSLVREGDDITPLGVSADSGPAIHDVGLRLAWRWQLGANTALAIHAPLLLPTANDDDVLALGFGVRPTLALSQWVGRAQLLFNFSFLLRDRSELGDYRGGNELGARFAFRYLLGARGQTGLLAELAMATSARDPFSSSATPAEARVGFEHQLSRKLLFRACVGTGLGSGIGAPDLRVGLGLAFTDEAARSTHPRSGDRDGDGVVDVQDRCLDDAEDRDGFEDGDGCVEGDNDRDGFLDVDDDCPQAPETRNGILDDDGCPDFIELEESSIVTLQPVFFETDSEQVAERSHPMLDEIAATLDANPQLAVSIEGHTDSVDDDAHNLALSERRANSVRTYLIERGLDANRVSAVGHGESEPIAGNDTEEGRALNRRVEFRIYAIRDSESAP